MKDVSTQDPKHHMYLGRKYRGNTTYAFGRCTCGWNGDGQEAIDQHLATHSEEQEQVGAG